VTALGWTLLALSAAAAFKAWRIDLMLRVLIPPSTEDIWRRDLIRDIQRFRPEFAVFEVLDAQMIPLRWRRQYHGARGAQLTDRLALTIIGAVIAGALGVGLLGAGLPG
jgi:hypothetical protein